MYVLLLTYKKPLEEMEKHLEAHRAYLRNFYASGHLIASGPQVPRTGGVIIGNFKDQAEMEAFVAGDPFQSNGMVEYKPIQFDAVLTTDRLK